LGDFGQRGLEPTVSFDCTLGYGPSPRAKDSICKCGRIHWLPDESNRRANPVSRSGVLPTPARVIRRLFPMYHLSARGVGRLYAFDSRRPLGHSAAMRRVAFLVTAALVGGVLLVFAILPGVVERGQNKVLQPPPYTTSVAARHFHDTLFVADLHADALLWNRNLLSYGTYGHIDIPRLAKGGVALQIFGVVTQVPAGQNYDSNDLQSDLITQLAVVQLWPAATWSSPKERALYQAEKLHDFAARSGGDLTVIESVPQLDRFVEQRRTNAELVAGLLAIEGLQAIEGQLANLDALRTAGFRMMGLTHFFDNQVGGSAHGVTKGGLTEFGRQVVQRMEEEHVIVDLAHASPRLIDDVLAMATRPLAVSHTGLKGTCEHIRNLSDEHVRRIAATGGVIGIGYWDAAVCDVSVAGIVRAIQYAVSVAGVDHVGLGSDFDGATTAPFDTTGIPLITDGLRNAGVSDDDVAKIMGANVLRVLRATLPER
jgi:membrane dipeptidase